MACLFACVFLGCGTLSSLGHRTFHHAGDLQSSIALRRCIVVKSNEEKKNSEQRSYNVCVVWLPTPRHVQFCYNIKLACSQGWIAYVCRLIFTQKYTGSPKSYKKKKHLLWFFNRVWPIHSYDHWYASLLSWSRLLFLETSHCKAKSILTHRLTKFIFTLGCFSGKEAIW